MESPGLRVLLASQCPRYDAPLSGKADCSCSCPFELVTSEVDSGLNQVVAVELPPLGREASGAPLRHILGPLLQVGR